MYGVVGPNEGDNVSSTGRSAEVRLSIPADSAYIAVPRSVVGNLAARNDFTVDAIDDLRIAVDEACALLLPQASDGVLELRLRDRPAAADRADECRRTERLASGHQFVRLDRADRAGRVGGRRDHRRAGSPSP